MVHADGLKALEAAADRHRASGRTLHEEIFRAHRAGASFQTIAAVTGLSDRNVSVIVGRVARWIEREEKALDSEVYAVSVASRVGGAQERTKRLEYLDWLRAGTSEEVERAAVRDDDAVVALPSLVDTLIDALPR